MHIDFNPRPPRPPVPLPPGAVTKSSDLLPGIATYAIQDRFLRHYNRPNGRSTNSVQLDGRWLTMLQNDANFPPTRDRIIGRLANRAKRLIDRLPCDESMTFTDAGYELMPTVPYSDMSWAIGHYSLYWKATGKIGPRRCNVPVANCDSGRGSTAEISFSIDWTIYDVFDFDWRIVFMVPFWIGSPFHVFAEWTTQHTSSASTCRDAPKKPPPCQEELRMKRTYEVLTCIYREGVDRPQISTSGAVNSAMGRLLQDGKEWCGTGRCVSGTCQPRFPKVSARVGTTRDVPGDNGMIECKTKVTVTATITCTCGDPLDQTFPSPD